jgi:putative tryptophan/tyrosine transport system substrate-binding protein
MKRRTFIAGLGGAALAWPLAASAQQPGRIYRIGFLLPDLRDSSPVIALFDELRLNSLIESQNLEVLPNGFDVRDEQIHELATALVKAAPDAIVAGPERPLRALQAATRTVPLIGMSEDLVAEGLVASLARPGGNTTGISLLSPELDGKRQDLLIEATPRARRVAALYDSRVTPPKHLQSLENDAQAHHVQLSVFGVARPEEAIDAAKTSNAEALNFLATPLGRWPINFSSSSEGTDRTDRPGSKPKDETDGFHDYRNRSLCSRFEVTNREEEPDQTGNPHE